MNLEKIAVLILAAVIALLLGVAIVSGGERRPADESDSSSKVESNLDQSDPPNYSIDDLVRYSRRKNDNGGGSRRLDFDDARNGAYRTRSGSKKSAKKNGGDSDLKSQSKKTEPTYEMVTIRPGDSLSGIAKRLYGKASAYRRIVAANPGLDPRRLSLGKKIRVPIDGKRGGDVDGGNDGGNDGGDDVNADAGDARRHEVRRRDTLSGIAKKYYGAATRWKDIYAANRSVLRRPNDLRPGMMITIP